MTLYTIFQHYCNDREETVWDEMKIAGDREGEETVRERIVTEDETPIIDVISDGC